MRMLSTLFTYHYEAQRLTVQVQTNETKHPNCDLCRKKCSVPQSAHI